MGLWGGVDLFVILPQPAPEKPSRVQERQNRMNQHLLYQTARSATLMRCALGGILIKVVAPSLTPDALQSTPKGGVLS
jgi:hypothetical protein